MDKDARIYVEWCEPNGSWLTSYRKSSEHPWTHAEADNLDELRDDLMDAAVSITEA